MNRADPHAAAPRRVSVVTAGLSQPSTTRLLADRIDEAVRRLAATAGLAVETEVVELREHARSLADHLVTGFAGDDLAAVLDRVARADGVVAVTPVFSASYSGLFKTFFDLLETDALADTPVLMGATAGTGRHSLVLEHAMRPLFAYLGATTVSTAVFAATDDFGGAAGPDVAERVDRAAAELVALLSGTRPGSRGDLPSGARPRRPAHPAPDEEYGEVIPFDQLLHR